jgi:hypothetical protein
LKGSDGREQEVKSIVPFCRNVKILLERDLFFDERKWQMQEAKARLWRRARHAPC